MGDVIRVLFLLSDPGLDIGKKRAIRTKTDFRILGVSILKRPMFHKCMNQARERQPNI